ncbi:sulfhydryl oxidase [Sparganum proliferum]
MLLNASRENQFIQPIISNALIILDFHNHIRIPMRSFIDTNLAEETYGLTSPSGEILLYNATEGEVRKYLKDHFTPDYVDVSVATEPITSTPVSTTTPKVSPPELLPVYAADIVASLRHVLFNDVGMKSVITGEDLDALKEFIEAVRRFLVLDSHYNFSIDSIKNQLSGQTSVSADQWNAILTKSGFPTSKVKYVACKGSKQQFRGYPCGLWVMFHAMTVKRFLEGQKGESTPSVAHALNRFVPRFFSCGYCAFHFAALTSNVRYANDSVFPKRGEKPPFELVVPPPSSLPPAPKTPRDEVLWLNTVHNRVNKRLAGQPSDDPQAPKAIFPSPYQCPSCWSPEARERMKRDRFSAVPDREEELFAFLLHHYRPSSWKWTGLDVSYSAMDWGDHAFRSGGFTTVDLVLVALVSVGCTLLVLALVYFVSCGRRKRLGYRTTTPV